MVKCVVCQQPVPAGTVPVYKYGQTYCASCSAKVERISSDLLDRREYAGGLPFTAANLSFPDILGLISFILAMVGLVTGGFLCIVAFIMSFFAIGKERWHFGAFVFYAGFSLLFTVAVLAMIMALHAWA